MNKALITKFYTAFQNGDFKTMHSCYADNAIFNDQVFLNLDAEQVKAMWQMLLMRGKDLKIEFGNITANEKTGSAEWVATYTFSATGRKVVNRIKADFVFAGGKITRHNDHFNFYNWARQALGLSGLLLGWTSGMKKRVQMTAAKSLENFMIQSAQKAKTGS